MSETICTPLLLVVAADVEEVETVRDVGRGTRVTGVRGLEIVGKVVDRDIVEIGDGRLVGFPELSPARCSRSDWPEYLADAFRLGVVVTVEGVHSATGDRSDSCSSPGRLEWRRSSSEGMDILGNCWREDEDFEGGFSSTDEVEVVEAAVADASCSLSIATSSWESVIKRLLAESREHNIVYNHLSSRP